jgi:hypothetical protein
MKPNTVVTIQYFSNSGGEVGQAVGDVRTGLADYPESLRHARGLEGQENDHCDNQE